MKSFVPLGEYASSFKIKAMKHENFHIEKKETRMITHKRERKEEEKGGPTPIWTDKTRYTADTGRGKIILAGGSEGKFTSSEIL